MGHDSHIVRFKVISLECQSMPNGQQYTVYYRRGDVARSTPCYMAQDGVVDFSTMPEGASVVHFKSGKGGNRFAPKMIAMRVEEYTRGQPRRAVGQFEIDCTQVLRSSYQGSGIIMQGSRMYGAPAKISVAVLVYPRNGPPLNFDSLISVNQNAKKAVPKGNVKTMTRGEAMTLLISLETMLERRNDEVSKPPTTKLEKRLQELEERRKKLTSTQGLASAVVTARTQDVIEAQFTAVAYKQRNNYIGESAAYFREMALTSGAAGGAIANSENAKKQLISAETRIVELKSNLNKLTEEQNALGRIQHKTDVTQELCANLEKVASIENQLKMLEASREALRKEVAKTENVSSPLQKEVIAVRDRVNALEEEQKELQAKIRHMTQVATTNVLTWARGKNPPEPSAVQKEETDDLFSPSSADENLKETQRKAIMDAFKAAKPSAPLPTARSSSSSSSDGNGRNDDLFGGAPGLPSLGDFGQKKEINNSNAPKPREDPLRPAGMGVDMFSAKPQQTNNSGYGGAPSKSDFNFAASANNKQQPPPTFDFGAILNSATKGEEPSAGFSFEPMQSSPLTQKNEPSGYQTFQIEPQGQSNPNFGYDNNTSSSAPAQQQASDNKKNDDPYYDDIDDYTVPPDVVNPPTVEFASDFTFGTEENKPASPGVPSTSMGQAAAPRPTFNFGPAETEDASRADTGVSVSYTKPDYDFGGGGMGGGGDNTFGGFGSSNNNNNNNGNYGSGLPSYNFGS